MNSLPGRAARSRAAALWVAWLVGSGCTQHEQPAQQAKPDIVPEMVTTAEQPLPLPDLPPASKLEAGILLHEVSLPDVGRLWIYLPERPAHTPVPCVLIAPAGNYGCLALDLDESDRPEHLPYVREGFGVVAFALGGMKPVRKPNTAQFVAGAREYVLREAGLVNARRALDYVEAKLPAVDTQRIYMAGHSSAATNALCIAAREPRIKACIAYAAGWTDLAEQLDPKLAGFLGDQIPDYLEFLRNASPVTHAASLRCPVFLFHARDDTATPIERSEAFAARLESTNPAVTFIPVERGGHYDSMINEGTPLAIRWLRLLKAGDDAVGGTP